MQAARYTEHPGFFTRSGPFPLQVIAAKLGAELEQLAAGCSEIEDVKPLGSAGPQHLAFFDNPKYIDQLAATHAGGCLVAPSFAGRVPADTAILKTKTPYSAFAFALRLFYADALHPVAARLEDERGRGTLIHPTARIEQGVKIEPGAVIGAEAQIGSGTTVAAGAVVGYRVVVGSDCYIGPCATLMHCFIGDRTILHAGVRIGQDGFGFAMSSKGHLKVPQVGRVIVGDDVEIGANSAVDRGALNDTMIGEGTKIDNLVQIGHNAIIGRHCVLVAQTGIAGSAQLGDFVVMGGHSGVVGHVKIGDGAQIAGMAHVKNDVPPGARMGGTPAVPFKEWAREVATLKRLAAASRNGTGSA
ncbi:UDP-3-O-acylglucosamine N-acyltransferase [Hyphomicrobium sp. 1Nfss2.1]|uniref:UDP-3-O-(3-hydroxymyristoyl)glucosamine N-acyltransferase n=1 Tax=Hyphomicrobium sp. 1Nfss2.1 TaxID=3413936 RepID=UPI003C7B5943